MQPIRVLIADDDPVFRTAIRRALATTPDIGMVGEAALGVEAVQMAAELQPDVVLMDLAMPVLDGMKATQRIRERCPQTRIIVLSIFGTGIMQMLMREAGAVAYVPKSKHADMLVPTILAVGRSGSGDQLPSPA